MNKDTLHRCYGCDIYFDLDEMQAYTSENAKNSIFLCKKCYAKHEPVSISKSIILDKDIGTDTSDKILKSIDITRF